MSRVAVCADVHVHNPVILGGPRVRGLNARAWLIVRTLRAATSQALEANAPTLVIAGDLFDSSKPSPQMIAAVAEVLDAYATEGGSTIIVRGNHDQASEEPGDDALGPLAYVPQVRVISRPQRLSYVDAELILLPYQTGSANAWVEDELRSAQGFIGYAAKNPRLCVLHAGIRTADNGRAPWAAAATDAVDVELLRGAAADADISCVIAGNWHEYLAIDTDGYCPRVVQVGALCPTGWDNPGYDGYGGLEIWDSTNPTETERFELAGPRFLTWLPNRPRAGNQFFVRLRVPREERDAAARALRAAKECGEVEDGMVEVVGEKAELRDVLSRAVGADSLLAAVDRYLIRRNKEVGARLSAVVRERCLGYLR